jgi:hypothetical protein
LPVSFAKPAAATKIDNCHGFDSLDEPRGDGGATLANILWLFWLVAAA